MMLAALTSRSSALMMNLSLPRALRLARALRLLVATGGSVLARALRLARALVATGGSVLARALSLALALGLLLATGRSTLARLLVASPAVVGPPGEEAAPRAAVAVGQAVPWRRVELRRPPSPEGSVAASAAPHPTQRGSFRGRTACTYSID